MKLRRLCRSKERISKYLPSEDDQKLGFGDHNNRHAVHGRVRDGCVQNDHVQKTKTTVGNRPSVTPERFRFELCQRLHAANRTKNGGHSCS